MYLHATYPPSHTSMQWCKSTDLLKICFSFYRCGGSVGFAPTSLKPKLDLLQDARSIRFAYHLNNIDEE